MTAGTETEIQTRDDEEERAPPLGLMGLIRRAWRFISFGGFSSITRRIVFLNLLALVVLVVAILVLNQSRNSLIDAEVRSLTAQGELIANSIAAQAINTRGPNALQLPPNPEALLDEEAAANYLAALGAVFPIDPVRASMLINFLSTSAGPRVRVYSRTGSRIVDSDINDIALFNLPPPGEDQPSLLGRIWDSISAWFRRNDLPVYHEYDVNEGLQYEGVAAAVSTGELTTITYVTEGGELIVSVAVPIRNYQSIQGAVLLTTREGDIDDIIREERVDILRVFAVAAAVSLLLSFLLAGTIAAPLRRLAAAAERVRKGLRTRPQIPDFSKRGDEIGDLSMALREMTSSLYSRIDAIERFAADVAHELKNPLTSLRSAVETLPLAKTPESKERLAEIIQHDVRRLDRLITDIADASRLDAELTRRDAEPFDAAKLLQAVADMANETADEGRARVALKVAKAEPDDYLIVGHDARLSQVLNNLIDNARSFSPKGGIIQIKLRRVGKEIEIKVEDQGPGIKAEMIERVFERFYTDRPEGESFGQNSGLGLSISQQIVEAHGGRIWAENITVVGGEGDAAPAVLGARFVVRLPAAKR
jgi:two-component system sensor histidine kinase ChvG